MKKYLINVTQLNYGTVEVWADNDIDAIDAAHRAVSEGSADWHDSETTDVTIVEYYQS